MRDNILPEEKLLRLIRGQKQQIPVDKKSVTATSDSRPAIKYSIRALIIKYSSFKYLQKTIWVTFAASCIYLIISFIYPWVALKKIKLPEVTPEKINETTTGPGIEVKPYEFYLEGLKNRQIFGSVSTQETTKPASVVNVDLVKDINLVGIISGEPIQAVIEDKKTQKTYYVTKGQFIGEFQVEDIQEGKIILNYQGQRFELYL